jgi:CzcA family heavy metal efflux pump
MNVARLAQRNSRAVILLTIFLVVAGLGAIFRLPSNIYPELSFPRIMVLVHAGDLPQQSVLLQVTRPIEESVSTVLGVRRVRSKTIRGASEISVLFAPDMDMQIALQLVQARVTESRAGMPADTEIEVERVTPAVFPILSLILSGNVPGADLRDFAFYNLRPMFSRVAGVSRVEVQASDTREISVIVDPQRALAHRLALTEVADRLRATNQVTAVGRLDKDYSQYLIVASGQFTNLEQIRDSVVAVENNVPVRLRDIAEVREGVQDRLVLITGNGKPAALINIARQIGGNILQIAADVERITRNLGSAIPATLRISYVYDLAEFVREAIGNVRDAILIGSFLALVILFLFLREPRTTLIAAVSLPVTAVSTFFFVSLFGGTLNLMSLGGLAISIGLVIDDAVVIIENIYRHLGLGQSPSAAAEIGTQELLGPVIGSTITTVVVFAPLGLLKGVVGDFFSALSLTLTASVLLSLIFAVTLIPLLSQRYLSASSYRESSHAFMEPVNRLYARGLRGALRHRMMVAATALGALILGVFLFTRLQTGFLPEMDEGGFVVDYMTPPGTSLAQTDRLVRRIEELVAHLPEVAAFSRRTGAEMGLFVTQQTKGDILVKLKPRGQRSRKIDDIISDLRHQIESNIPGFDSVEFVQILQDMLGDLEGSPEPVEVKLFSSHPEDLEHIADEIEPKLLKIPGIVDYKGIQKGNPEIVIQVDPVQAGRLGLTVDQVSQQTHAGLLGDIATDFRQPDRTIGIRVRFPDAFRFDYTEVQQFPIITPARQVVPLSALASVEQARSQGQLRRENQRLMVVLTARLENRDLGSTIRDVKQLLDQTRLPVGTTYEIGGQYESQQAAFRDLLSVLVLALAAVFTVLVIQFREFRPALIILSAAPLSLFGVFAALLLTGTALNVSSFMGIILMVGLVVKNGIILMQYVRQLRDEQGLPIDDALVAAGTIRLRPILMTTLCTLFGLLPLALGLGSGAELQKPLALAVIGGLSLSTFITLLMLPVFYSFTEARAARS